MNKFFTILSLLFCFTSQLYSNVQDTIRLDKESHSYARYGRLISTDLKGFDYKRIENAINIEHLSIVSCRNLDINLLFESCKSLKKIQQLDIIGCGMIVLPNSIRYVSQIRILNLRDNPLRSFPDSIVLLQQLETLGLSVNSYLYDSDVYSKLKFMNVKSLDFSSSGLFEIDPSIGEVKSLRSINLANNAIKRFPKELFNLHLESIDLSQNMNLDSIQIFDQLTHFSDLKSLNLSNCELKSLPNGICSLTQLENLDLNGNVLTSLPNDIGNLKSLKRLDLGMEGISLRANQLSSLPVSFSNFKNLEYLDLAGNKLVVLPDGFGTLSKLKYLDLHFNALSDFPSQLVNLTSLIYLNLNGNSLVNLPEGLGKLVQLEELRLDNNFFNRFQFKIKKLPISIGNLVKLKVLTLRDNVVEELPGTIGNLVNLELLDLRDNLLNKLPEEVCKLKKLKYLDVKANEISSLPFCFGELQNMEDLTIAFNSGLKADSVLPLISKMDKLRFFDCSYNDFPKEKLLSFLETKPNCKVVNLNHRKGEAMPPREKREEMYKFEKPVDR